MKWFIETSGGFANLRLAGQLDTKDLPGDLAERAKQILNPDKLKKLKPPDPASGQADVIQYRLNVSDHKGRHEFHLCETDMPAEMLDVLDEMTTELKRRKLQQRDQGSE